ncbi:MAG: adenylate/guanylate cyclase domain-containing protein [Verrucomicrobiae bacterium]|nr:adenylate/guanylate cyclase domain-containing protein [Verrucomicrobiae bacterium]
MPEKEVLYRWFAALFGSFAAIVLGLGMLHPSNPLLFGESLIDSSYIYLFKFKKPVKPSEVVMVYMDDESHRELNQPYHMGWDRSVHAKLLNKMSEDGVRAVAYDIIFSGPHPLNPAGDAEFAEAIKKNGRVVLGAEFLVDSVTGGPTFSRAYDPLYDSAACPLGVVQVYADRDIMVKRHLHVPPSSEEIEQSSLSWETARICGARVTRDLAERYRERWINYYGPPETIPWISFHAALTGQRGFFSNKVVFVGAFLKTYYSGQRKDEYKTPYTMEGRFAPGVDIQATQFLNLVREDWLERPTKAIERLLFILFGLWIGIFLIRLPPYSAILWGVLMAVGVTVLSVIFFLKLRVWFPWLIMVLVQIPAATVWSWGYNSLRLFIKNRLLEQSLSAYVSPARVKQLLKQPEILHPGAEKQVLSILFSDIENFTHISENMDSDELARAMNEYFENAVSKIHETEGTVIKFIGDSIFAVWNAPLPQPDHELRAARAGLLLSQAIEAFIKSGNVPRLRTRIGLHTGVANVGNFGSEKRFDYTAIGESVNLASRMEGLNKFLGTTILATGDLQRATADVFLWRYLGRFILKGFEKAVDVYELLGENDGRYSEEMEWKVVFDLSLKHFEKRDFVTARKLLEDVLRMRPQDGPSVFYLREIAELENANLSPGWRGEVEIKEK